MTRRMVSVMLAAMAAAATPALASGSGSGSGTGGGGSIGGFNRFDSILEQQRRLEERGRSQVKKRITCKACEYKDGVNRLNADMVAQAVRSGTFEFTQKDREAVLFYLKQRYGV